MEYAKKYCLIETYIGPSCKHELVQDVSIVSALPLVKELP